MCVVGRLPSFALANFPLAPSLNLVASIYWHKATRQIKQKMIISPVVDGKRITSQFVHPHPYSCAFKALLYTQRVFSV